MKTNAMKKPFISKVMCIVLMLTLAPLAGAASPSPQGMLEDLLDQEGRAYIQSREALIGEYSEFETLPTSSSERSDIEARSALSGEPSDHKGRATLQGESSDLKASLQGFIESRSYNEEDWHLLVFAEALLMHLNNPQAASRLRRLDGLNAEIYAQYRKPEPTALPELQRIGNAVPLMIELHMKELDIQEWSSEKAMESERHALQAGLFAAVGGSGHQASLFFLADVVKRGGLSDSLFWSAVQALGAVGSPEALPTLIAVMKEAGEDGNLMRQAAALQAMGSIHDARTWPYIEAALVHAEPGVRAAAIRAARAYGSTQRWDHDPALGDKMRWRAATSMVELLIQSEDEQIIGAVWESLGLLSTPELKRWLTDQHALAAAAGKSGKEARLRQASELVNLSLSRRGDW